jgi:hypothetical protein
MANQKLPIAHSLSQFQEADVHISFGDKRFMNASVRFSGIGLLSVAALVSSILLSTAVIVKTAQRRKRISGSGHHEPPRLPSY